VKRAPRADVFVLLLTFGLTVLADLVIAVNIGVIVAALLFLRRMAGAVEVRQATAEELQRELAREGWAGLPPGVLVYTVDGPFFFGAVENFERALAGSHTDPSVLVIRLRWVPFVDITALQALEDAIDALRRRGVRVVLCGANRRVLARLERAGVLERVGRENVFTEIGDALAACAPGTPEPAAASVLGRSAEALLAISRSYFGVREERPGRSARDH